MASLQSEASGRPSLPFGYGIEPPPPESRSTLPLTTLGTPILSETDNQTLHDFFESVSSTQCNNFSFGEGLNLPAAWEALPPNLMGTATSFGSQPAVAAPTTYVNNQYIFSSQRQDQQPRAFHFDHHLVSPDLPQYPQTTTLSDPYQTPTISHPYRPSTVSHPNQSHYQLDRHPSHDVPAANVTWAQPNHPSSAPQNAVNTQLPFRVSGELPGQMRHQNIEEFRADTRRSSNAVNHSPNMANWMSGPGSMSSLPKPTAIFDDIKWGSDISFNPAQGQAPGPPTDLTNVNLDNLESIFLDVDYSASNTTSNSPVVGESSTFSKVEDMSKGPLRKKRKSLNGKAVIYDRVDEAASVAATAAAAAADDDDDIAADDGDNGISRTRRRSQTERTGTSSSLDAPAAPAKKNRQRKKAAKEKRENLTEEQKRENHIRSEQKRRTVIRDGFDNLNRMVPSLRGGTFSKSTTLTVTAQWLEELVGGNEQLMAQLKKLDPEKASKILDLVDEELVRRRTQEEELEKRREERQRQKDGQGKQEEAEDDG
ncbi:hypothetical protein CP532_6942 [Ophiocordyceps camponoti-leonardi (nom. inval.)]|nr:hypothetical protein CP532_6942 [Ophiocordyceps camponoti-leonardi (nom. inval.)]